MSNFFSHAWDRLQAETPTFFKKVRNIGKSLMATGTAALVPQIVPEVKMPPILLTLGEHAVTIGFVMVLVASFACKDPADITPPKN